MRPRWGGVVRMTYSTCGPEPQQAEAHGHAVCGPGREVAANYTRVAFCDFATFAVGLCVGVLSTAWALLRLYL